MLNHGERCIQFIERLKLSDDFEGKPFRLHEWQKMLIRSLFGTLKPNGTRQYKRAFWALARKSGKTQLVAAILLYLLLGSGLRNQEIYSCSGDRKQAGLIWKAAASMIRQDPYLLSLCTLYEGHSKRIIVPVNGNTYEAMSSDAPSKHGYNPSVVLFDEVHVYPNRQLHDTLTSAFGARRDRLSIYISTAGTDRNSLCYELWQYARGVIDGSINDPEFYGVLFEASPEDDWTDETVWQKALPGLGSFTNLDFIRSECEQAKLSPAYERTFKQLYLNLWVEDLERGWLPINEWDQCAAPINWARYEGRQCFGGLDLSSTRDLSALSLVFPEDDGSYSLYVKFWVPGKSAFEKERMDGAPYTEWSRKGFVAMSNKPTQDYQQIARDILELNELYDLVSIGYDPWNAQMLADQLVSAGIDMLKYGQSFSNLNAPSKWLENLILNHNIIHDGNPCLRWNVLNTIAEIKGDVIRPSKAKSKTRIDGVVATVMALGICMNEQRIEPDEDECVYSLRGIISV
jgi:phage terminase large subunit-like protein